MFKQKKILSLFCILQQAAAAEEADQKEGKKEEVKAAE